MPRGNSYPRNRTERASSRPTPLDNHRYISLPEYVARGRCGVEFVRSFPVVSLRSTTGYWLTSLQLDRAKYPSIPVKNASQRCQQGHDKIAPRGKVVATRERDLLAIIPSTPRSEWASCGFVCRWRRRSHCTEQEQSGGRRARPCLPSFRCWERCRSPPSASRPCSTGDSRRNCLAVHALS